MFKPASKMEGHYTDIGANVKRYAAIRNKVKKIQKGAFILFPL
jgi:hypothetical protein